MSSQDTDLIIEAIDRNTEATKALALATLAGNEASGATLRRASTEALVIMLGINVGRRP